jgi:hypothetical protein
VGEIELNPDEVCEELTSSIGASSGRGVEFELVFGLVPALLNFLRELVGH